MASHTSSPASAQLRDSQSSLHRSSMRESAAVLFQTMMGQRKQDYHADAPQQNEPQQQHNNYSRSISSRTPRHPTAGESADQETTPDNNIAAVANRAATTARQQRRATMYAVLNSQAWKVALSVFSLILLFGAQVSELFLPPSTDTTVDAIFVLALTFFIVDILMRCESSEDHYFSRIRCTGICCLSVGSFLFWCDLVSALTLLTDISWINKRSFSEQQIQIALGDFGIPVRPVLPGSVM